MDRIDALRAFVRLAEGETFSAVARSQRVGQPTVSKWIAALEDEVGARLLARTTREHQLTAAGRRLLDRAVQIVALYDEAAADAASAAEGLRGRLRIGAPVVFGERFVAGPVAEFCRQHPGLDVELRLDDRYVGLVEAGLDLAVRVGTPRDSTYRARRLGHTPRRVVASPGYLKAHGRPGHPRDLKDHRCLTHSLLRVPDVWTFTKRGKRYRTRIAPKFGANHSAVLRTMALHDQGVALLAAWLVDDDVRAGRLVRLLPSYRAPEAPVQLLMLPGRLQPARVEALTAHLAACLPPAVKLTR